MGIYSDRIWRGTVVQHRTDTGSILRRDLHSCATNLYLSRWSSRRKKIVSCPCSSNLLLSPGKSCPLIRGIQDLPKLVGCPEELFSPASMRNISRRQPSFFRSSTVSSWFINLYFISNFYSFEYKVWLNLYHSSSKPLISSTYSNFRHDCLSSM